VSVIGFISRRSVVFLPSEARDGRDLFDLRAAYRIDGPLCTIDLLEQKKGVLEIEAIGYDGHFATMSLCTMRAAYGGPSTMVFDFNSGGVTLAGRDVGSVPTPLRGRRLAWGFCLMLPDGQRLRRKTAVYKAGGNDTVDSRYYYGDDYVDYELQSAGEHSKVVELIAQFGGKSPVLEIGCATGGLLERLRTEGFSAFGLDFSEWAVGEAQRKCGVDRVWRCDVESDPLPAGVLAQAPFGTVVLWAVYEHFRNPRAVLEKLSRLTVPGSLLLINTTNADSLSHLVFETDWEGYFDWTHHGVDTVSPRALKSDLRSLGWRVEVLETDRFWHAGVDPDHAALRDAWSNDARFRALLRARDLGDFVLCVAVKE
jgi:2-polyprenyl-3-methyl-5-hydroxy-6-metoxy-1,4-benzoquinol methylase